ncbi:MAG: DUF3592 domain-containing protein [Oscillospiraceae bacterium]|nr:DUF3592 domain-containing protein [Oscillospiraceae bacterium]
MNTIIIALIPVLIGIIMIISGFFLGKRPKGKIKDGIYTDALVIDFAFKTSYMKKVPYNTVSPVVEFNTENGKVNAVYPFFIHEDYIKFKRGDVIKICYDKNNTNKFHIENDNSKSNISLMLVLFGIFIILADALLFLQY